MTGKIKFQTKVRSKEKQPSQMKKPRKRHKMDDKEKFLNKMRRHLNSPSVKELLLDMPKSCGTSGETSKPLCIINSTFIPGNRSMVVQKMVAHKTRFKEKANFTCARELTSRSIRNILIQSKIASFKTVLQGCDKKAVESEDIFVSNSDKSHHQEQNKADLNDINLVKKLLVYGYNKIANAVVNPEEQFRNMKITTMDDIMEKLKNKLKKQCSIAADVGGGSKYDEKSLIDIKFSSGSSSSSSNKKLTTGRSSSSHPPKETFKYNRRVSQHLREDDDRNDSLHHLHHTQSNTLDETTNEWEKAFKSHFEEKLLSKKSCTSSEVPTSHFTSEQLEGRPDYFNYYPSKQPSSLTNKESGIQRGISSMVKSQMQSNQSFRKSRDYSSYDISNLLNWKENNFEKHLNCSIALPNPDDASKLLKRRTDSRPSSSYSSYKEKEDPSSDVLSNMKSMEELFADAELFPVGPTSTLRMNYLPSVANEARDFNCETERIQILERKEQEEFSKSFEENLNGSFADDGVFDEITNQASNHLKRRKDSPCSTYPTQEWDCKRSHVFSLNKEKSYTQLLQAGHVSSLECTKSQMSCFKPDESCRKARDYSSYDISFNLLNWKENNDKFQKDFQTNLNSPFAGYTPNDVGVKDLVYRAREENKIEDDYIPHPIKAGRNSFRLQKNRYDRDDMVASRDDEDAKQSQLNILGSSNEEFKAHHSSRDYSSYDISNLLNCK